MYIDHTKRTLKHNHVVYQFAHNSSPFHATMLRRNDMLQLALFVCRVAPPIRQLPPQLRQMPLPPQRLPRLRHPQSHGVRIGHSLSGRHRQMAHLMPSSRRHRCQTTPAQLQSLLKCGLHSLKVYASTSVACHSSTAPSQQQPSVHGSLFALCQLLARWSKWP